MKKTITKILALALVATVLLSFSGCFKAEKTDPANSTVTIDKTAASESLKAAKIATFSGRSYATPSSGGLKYKDEDSGRYGVISLDGQYDTGAQFVSCIDEEEGYFRVSYKTYTGNASDLASINASGVIDGKGNVLVPCNYAYVILSNSRYAKVFTITGRVYSEDEAIICYDDYFTTFISDEKEMFGGKWEFYDIKTGKIVPGVSSATTDSVSVHGNYIEYYNNAESKYMAVDGNGTPLEYKTLLSDGSYTVEKTDGTLYDTDGNKLFTYSLTGFKPTTPAGEYYIASKYENSVTSYVLLDKTGKEVSSVFNDKSITVYGSKIFHDGKLYNFDGTVAINGTYDSVTYDTIFNNAWALSADKEVTFINSNNEVLFKGKRTDDVSINSSDFGSYKQVDGTYCSYSFKDNDYTIKGLPKEAWIVERSAANGIYELVDSTNNEVLITGYKSYACAVVAERTLYVYATVNGITDVYVVVRESEFVDYEQLKTDLLGDLVDAFNAEGIIVTVDKNTGELALDSNVLFGGDSAVLTDDGKELLEKFMNAYTSIIYNDKYKDFVQDTIIEGHTAPVPGTTYEDGIDLSIERAENVLNYCTALKTSVDTKTLEDTFTSIGYSCSKPVFDENGEVVMDACRRVSFRIIVDTSAY